MTSHPSHTHHDDDEDDDEASPTLTPSQDHKRTKKTQVNTFLKQLSNYEFKGKHTYQPRRTSFFRHKDFIRGDEDRCMSIRRKQPPNNARNAAAIKTSTPATTPPPTTTGAGAISADDNANSTPQLHAHHQHQPHTDSYAPLPQGSTSTLTKNNKRKGEQSPPISPMRPIAPSPVRQHNTTDLSTAHQDHHNGHDEAQLPPSKRLRAAAQPPPGATPVNLTPPTTSMGVPPLRCETPPLVLDTMAVARKLEHVQQQQHPPVHMHHATPPPPPPPPASAITADMAETHQQGCMESNDHTLGESAVISSDMGFDFEVAEVLLNLSRGPSAWWVKGHTVVGCAE